MIVYEFDSVRGRDGSDKFNQEKHSNPVHLSVVIKGRTAIMLYADVDKHLETSIVESIEIIHGQVLIMTENTEYVMRPHIRK